LRRREDTGLAARRERATWLRHLDDPFSKPNAWLDYFEFDWRNKQYVRNQLSPA
jgi:hypothetical protein